MSFVSERFAGIIQDEKLQNKNRVPFSGLCFCYSSSGYPGIYVSESRGSADKPHLVFSKPSGCKPCTQSGECSGENSADGQHRQINKNTCRAKDHHGDTDPRLWKRAPITLIKGMCFFPSSRKSSAMATKQNRPPHRL